VEVLISRATMKTQLKGNRMKKKSVMRKNMGKMLETLSPAYSIAKGKGPISQLASAGGLGLVPAMVARPQRKKAKARKAARMASAPQSPSAGMGMPEMTRRMAMGGTVKRSKSIDGIAMKGKTRA
tara:strand:+ start:5397 stop:5771 length:375 start_codon:yes stop_codon:yes gene_type:complete